MDKPGKKYPDLSLLPNDHSRARTDSQYVYGGFGNLYRAFLYFKINRLAGGYTASNGKKALAKMDNKEIECPDLIFLDINMPVMDGWKCLSLLKNREEYSKIPVILYSTSSYPEDIGYQIALQSQSCSAFIHFKPNSL